MPLIEADVVSWHLKYIIIVFFLTLLSTSHLQHLALVCDTSWLLVLTP